MAKNIRPTPVKSGSRKSMIPLHSQNDFSWTKEGVRTGVKPKQKYLSESEMKAKLKTSAGFTAKMITDYLTLSAKTPFVKDKGFMNALNCQSVFPSDPNVSFPWWSPQDQPFPTAGKIELWLENLEDHQNLTVEIRTTGYSSNGSSALEVRSSLSGLYGYFPVKPDSKIDLFFPDINTGGSIINLITIEANDMNGSWGFFDAKINLVE